MAPFSFFPLEHLKLFIILLHKQECEYSSVKNFIKRLNHCYEMRPSSLWVSLDFEWIWTFLPSEIV
jgi:hypothetical protein